MKTTFDHSLQAATMALQAALHLQTRTPAVSHNLVKQVRFITICRQAGAGGKTLAVAIAKAINELQPSDSPWIAWDHELIEKVAGESGLDCHMAEKLETQHASWFQDLIASFSNTPDPNEFAIYRRVTQSIRALANAGNAIIVGRGGVFATNDVPGGLHIRLVAPLEDRIKSMASRLNIATVAAAKQVHEIDRARESFYRRYWPQHDLRPESFSLTINTARLTEREIVNCLLPLIVDSGLSHAQRELMGACRACSQSGGGR